MTKWDDNGGGGDDDDDDDNDNGGGGGGGDNDDINDDNGHDDNRHSQPQLLTFKQIFIHALHKEIIWGWSHHTIKKSRTVKKSQWHDF